MSFRRLNRQVLSLVSCRTFSDNKVLPPHHYIDRISRDGKVIPGEIDSSELLVSHYQTNNFRDCFFEMIASGATNKTGYEGYGRIIYKFAKRLGAFKSKEQFFRFKPFPYPEAEITEIVHGLKSESLRKFQDLMKSDKPTIRIFITGGTGFLGLDFLEAIANDSQVQEVLCLVYNREMEGIPVEIYKKNVMDRLHVAMENRSKFNFVPGDVTLDDFGLPQDVIAHLKAKTTHMIHLAASVSFLDPYDKMYKANVLATQKALNFGLSLQQAPGSPFVNFISTETCFIHGRQPPPRTCKEEELEFPRDYYNNFYEPTKALASIEAKMFMLKTKLRLIALCPAITVGHSKTGNNRGDTKVINAAANTLGRIHYMIRTICPFPMLWPILYLGVTFPCSTTANMDLVPVDRITDALVASIRKPLATGERIHLTCGGIQIKKIRDNWSKELAMYVTNPVIHRLLFQPVLFGIMRAAGQNKLADVTKRLYSIFCVYAEWGQPIHNVGNDVRLLGLSPERPNLEQTLILLFRHNQFVQDFGRIRDPLEIAKREKIWEKFIMEVEKRTGKSVGQMSAEQWKYEQQALKEILPGLIQTYWLKN